MKLDDAVFNWLQIKVVSENRPSDHAAKDTFDFFSTVIAEDYGIRNIVVEKEDLLYRVHYEHEGTKKSKVFDRVAVDYLYTSITNEPKYNESFVMDEEN